MGPVLLILVRDRPGPPGPASSWAIGRAALQILSTSPDVPIVFGHDVRRGAVSGLRLDPDGAWRPVARAPVGAVAMRFPRRSHPGPFGAALAGLSDADHVIPIANPLGLSDLTADKLATQVALGGVVPMPDVEADVSRFRDALDDWDTAFLKPRYGSLGEGVRRVRRGEAIPELEPGEWLLQRAIEPPRGVAGVALRVLVQRPCAEDVGPDWVVPTAVARISDDDPTVSVERGARVTLASNVMAEDDVREMADQARAVAGALSRAGTWDPEDVLEMGIDFVVDREGRPWVIEVNSIPRGRLAALATIDDRLRAEHEQAIRRPLRILADRI